MKRSLSAVFEETRKLVSAGRLKDAASLFQAELLGKPLNRGPDEAPAEAYNPLLRMRPRFPGFGASLSPKARTHTPPPMPDGAAFERHSYAGPAGERPYRLYVPSKPADAPRALVVMLHGCTQNPEDFATGTRMNAWAEDTNFLVAYPEQIQSANQSLCWNWFEPGHQDGGAGEPAILAGIVAEIASNHAVDRGRIFVAGLSAGGAMAAVLGATHPGLFAAVAVHSGLPYRSATNVASALSVMRSGRGRTPESWQGPRLFVMHGTKDRTVHAENGAALAGLDARRSETRISSEIVNGRECTRTVLARRDGVPEIEHWLVTGLAHAWSGGDTAGSYCDPEGPDATGEMVRFFFANA